MDMDLRKFGWMLFCLGLILGLAAAYQLYIPHMERWEHVTAIMETTRRGGSPSSTHLLIEARFADARKLGMWLGIASGVTCFLGIALVFSAKKEPSLMDAS
jgi:hypothetical protein